MTKIYLQGYCGHNNLGNNYLFCSIMNNILLTKNECFANVDTKNGNVWRLKFQGIREQ